MNLGSGRTRYLPALLVLATVAALVALGATTVPTDIQIPGTQPNELTTTVTSVSNCGCHDFSVGPTAPLDSAPVFGWQGGMMANAGRDPLFWATVAIAEQDFDGVGDLCLHCHSVKGWLEGRSTPTNGSGLDPTLDGEGIMCEFCHLMVDPDMANNVPSPPEGSYAEAQSAPFFAYDDDTGSPTYGQGYYGGAEYVLNDGGTRLGPYDNHGARHDAVGTDFFRDARYCGTCHDVSNPAVGDLAANHGSIAPFTGPFSGVPGALGGLAEDKAAQNNEPHTYGIVERTFSEYVASALDDWEVSNFDALPPELKVPGGAFEIAYQRSLWGNCDGTPEGDFCKVDADCEAGQTCVIPPNNTDYEDGTTRYFTCQTCHMAASGGEGANQGRPSPHKGEIRADLPRHDQTGMSYWIQDVVQYQDTEGTLLFGSGLTAQENAAMDAAQIRSADHLRSAGSLSATQVNDHLEVTVTNLTGHKLISGYPEGRRMWLNLIWKDDQGAEIHQNGEYGPLEHDGSPVTAPDRNGTPIQVHSILDPDSTEVYEAEPAMTQDWAAALMSLGYPGTMVLTWDRETHLPEHTLADLAAEEPGEEEHTFHFVLNNAIHHDNRIPPYGYDYDLALERNAPPVPLDQYGNPGPGGTYNHFDVVEFDIPPGAASVDVKLLYQATSWEYVQFLWLQNDGSDDPTPPLGDSFLGNEGIYFLDAWLHTGMAAPLEMTTTSASVTGVSFNAPGHASLAPDPLMQVTSFNAGAGEISFSYSPACDADGHTVHYGALSGVDTYAWADAACGFDNSGNALFVPDPAVGESIFWVVVGNNPSFEGSYNTDSFAVERPANTGSAGACFRPQNLATVCE
jgi:hypothetical protein